MPESLKLRIHVRRVATGDGALETQDEVYCPPRDRSLRVAECEACADYAGTEVDLRGDGAWVLCRRLPAGAAGALRVARHGYAGRHHSPPADSAGEHTPVSAIMAADVLCVREDLTLERARRLLVERGVSGAPVVNERGEPAGVISQRDLLRHEDAGLVGDAMTPLAFVLPESASVSQAAALMSLERVHRLPVVGDDGRVVGIVSSLDVLRWLARRDGYLTSESR